MNSAGAIDVKALSWVRGEISQALEQIRQALEVYVDSADPTKLDFIITQLHQVTGTLQIVELFGAALLSEEMEHLAQALKNQQVKSQQDAFEVLTRGVLQLPGYLEHLSHGHRDQPVVLMPLLNDLRAAYGQPLLSENGLFVPDLTLLPAAKTTPSPTVNVRLLAKKLRGVFQAALVGLIRANDLPAQYRKLSYVFAQLDEACTRPAARQLWWAAHGVVEALMDKGLEANVAVKSLLGQIDRQLKTIVDHGEEGVQKSPPSDLVKNLLYYVARSTSQGGRVNELKHSFRLAELVPTASELNQAQSDLLSLNAGVMENVTTALKEDLLAVKEIVDLFVRSKEHPLAELEPVIAKLRAMADTLSILGMGKLRKTIKEQEAALKAMLDGTQALNDEVVMGVASALLYVESSLSDLTRIDNAAEGDSSLLSGAEYRNVVKLTLQEAKTVLSRVKDAVMQFAVQPTAFELLEAVPGLIKGIHGALSMVEHQRAADMLQLVGQFIAHDLLDQRTELSAEKLDMLADAITGVEYFLESIDDDPSGAQYSVDVARESMARLGYAVHEPDSFFADEPGLLFAELAEPQTADKSRAATPVLRVVPSTANTTAPPPATTDEPLPLVDQEVLDIFLEEAAEEYLSITTQLAALQQNPPDENALQTLRRSFHTVKGSGRIVGATEIGEFAWAVENMLNRVLDKAIELSPSVFLVVQQARDLLPLLVDELRTGRKGTVTTQPLIELAQRVMSGDAVSAHAAAPQVDAAAESELLPTPEPVEVTEKTEVDKEIILSSAAPLPARVVDATLAEIFVNETRTHLAAINHFVERCVASESQCAIDDDLIRALHTLHGSAHMANIDEIAEVADALEKWAKLLQENQAVADIDAITLLRDSNSFIAATLNDLSDAHSFLPERTQLLQRIAELHQVASTQQSGRLQTAGSASTPYLAARDSIEVDTELVNVFLIEAAEAISRGLVEVNTWANVPEQAEYAEEIRRRLNTLQGGARIANLSTVAQVCHATINLLAQSLEHRLLGPDVVRLTHNALEWLSDSVQRLKQELLVETPTDLLSQLDSYGTAMLLLAEPTPMTGADSDADSELKAVFLNEATEILTALDEILKRWSVGFGDSSIVSDLQRSLHTLKGGARMARIDAIGDLSHQLESLLQRIEEGGLPANITAHDMLRAAHDWIAQGVDQLRMGMLLAPATELLDQIKALINSPAKLEPAPSALPRVDVTQEDLPSNAPNRNEEVITEKVAKIPTQDRQVIPFHRTNEPMRMEKMPEPANTGYDDDLVDVFLEEASEITLSMEELVGQWAKDTGDKAIVEKLQRALHTIKGGARMARATAIGDLCHSIESILESIVQGRVNANRQLIDLMHTAYDWLTAALEQVRDKAVVEPATELIAQIEAAVGMRTAIDTVKNTVRETLPARRNSTLIEQESGAIAAIIQAARNQQPAIIEAGLESPESPTAPAKAKAADEQVRVALGLLDQLVNHAGEVSIYRSRIELQHNSVRYNLVELSQTVNRLREQLRKFEIEAEAQILFRYEKAGVNDQEEFDPLELDRFSNMQQLSRSLVESVGDLGSIQKLLDNLTHESEILLLQQSRVSTSLQEGLMRTRLVPFSSVVSRLRRILRQTSKELDKNVELVVIGAEGEMDRSVLNRLTPALEHMLRNAVDHGIETPSQRRKSGKQDGGSVVLRFWREGQEIVLSITDDGSGMDLKAIRSKALEKGLMDKNSKLGNSEIMQFVLESGFSTAKTVTQISGRGVGMDVVNNEIKQLNGTLHIASEKGIGTTFTVRLPLTVSVNQALIVHVGEQTYAISLSSIDGVVRIGRDELDALHQDDQLPYDYAGVSYRFFHLGTVLNISQPVLPDEGIKIPLILARAGNHRVALQVESIIARQEVVIKSVGPQVSTVVGVSGATIMNDGGVALILDLASLMRAGIAHTGKREKALIPSVARISSIMIVDDSITVRKVTDRLLKRHGFETTTAKDGVDALAQLQEHLPDLMLLDIEMPRMDGYELATAMRNDDRLKHIPIIMITSRTGEKHRERAKAIGVKGYLGKPFQESELLATINELLKIKHGVVH